MTSCPLTRAQRAARQQPSMESTSSQCFLEMAKLTPDGRFFQLCDASRSQLSPKRTDATDEHAYVHDQSEASQESSTLRRFLVNFSLDFDIIAMYQPLKREREKMKIDIECVGFETDEDRNEFTADAKKAKVKWTLHEGKYYDHMVLEGDEKDVKKFVEDYWQVTDDDQTYDELLANGDIEVTVLD